MGKIVCFGEIMLRLSPPEYNIIENSNSFMSTYGGSEANIAVSLSCLGTKSEFISKLPKNQLGDGALKHLRGYGVICDNIRREHQNMGIYFLESGFGVRPSRVIYNRRHSAITTISIADIDVDQVFKDASWFHVSGISLALSPAVQTVVWFLMEEAKKRKITVSFDVNYRSRLWDKESCKKAIEAVLPNVDVLFASLFDITEILQIKSNMTEEFAKEGLFNQVISKYNLKYLFGTSREVHNASENSLSCYSFSADNQYHSSKYRFKIFDRVGGGDAFASGVLHILNKDFNNYQLACEFGLACSVLKHTLQGDAAVFKEAEIVNFINANGLEINR